MVTEELVEYIAAKNIVTTEEISKQVAEISGNERGNDYVYRKYMYPLLKKEYVDRIRQNLYHVTTPGKRNNTADGYLVASKIREDYYIAFHAALAFYGCAYSYRNQVHVAVQPIDRFDMFTYQNTEYTPYLTEDTSSGVVFEQYHGEEIRVASKERLFIECIDKPDYVGGWEEVLKSLWGLSGIDFNRLAELLLNKNNQTLLRRVGVVLEELSRRSLFYQHLEQDTMEKLQSHVEGGMRYLVNGEPGKADENWRLYIPANFWDYLRGI